MIRDDTTARFAAIESEIAEHLADSRRHGRQGTAALVTFLVVAAVLVLLVAKGLIPPPQTRTPPSSNVSSPG